MNYFHVINIDELILYVFRNSDEYFKSTKVVIFYICNAIYMKSQMLYAIDIQFISFSLLARLFILAN